MKAALLALSLMMLPSLAAAQARECRVPAVLPRAEPVPASEVKRRLMPVAAYTLALSWSPEYCRTRKTSAADRLQCGGEAGRFGFTLHGLWPDGRGGTWPQYCRPAAALPEPVVRGNLCTTPSVRLLQHEWAKHGTCVATDPARYFRAASRMYGAVRYPDMDALSRAPLTVGQFAERFAAANPGLDARMLIVDANRRGWLQEVRICLGRDLRPRACPRPMVARQLGRSLKIWRGG